MLNFIHVHSRVLHERERATKAVSKTHTVRFAAVDAMRGIAAVGVVLFHALAGSHVPHLAGSGDSLAARLLSCGRLGVPIFFVISGFVIAHSLRDARMSPRYFAGFLLRRSVRLDPPYWISIGLMIAYAAIAQSVVPGHREFHASIPQVMAHIFYLQDWLGFGQINEVYWTLCCEIQFYILFCFLLGVGRIFAKSDADHRAGTIVCFVAALFSALWPLGIFSGPGLRGSCLPTWHAFLIGVFAYWALRKQIPAIWFYILGAILLGGGIIHQTDFTIAAVVVAGWFLFLGMRGSLESTMNWRWIQWLGAISYSLYLIHNPVSGIVFRVTSKIGLTSAGGEGLAMMITLIACIAAAGAYYYLVERPSIALA
jgi:peptidoglycan/LPS O-acetylase OafA/YrhL